MDLPSTRELELEALVRQRDAQVSELKDELLRLRRYVSDQGSPSMTDVVTLPPPILSILGPHLRASVKESNPGSSTVINALVQKSRALQEENDELYDILKLKETGKLKEEVRGLRRVVQKLEAGLRESHTIITSLSIELDKTHEALVASSKHVSVPESRSTSRSPRAAFRDTNTNHSSTVGNGAARPPPTGPRAFKKPRLSDQRSQQSPPPNRPVTNTHNQYGTSSHAGSTRTSGGVGGNADQRHSRDHPRAVSYANDRERDREREPTSSLPNKPPPPSSRPPSSHTMDVDEEKRERKPRNNYGDKDRQRGTTLSSNPDGAAARDHYEGESRSRDRDRGRERSGRGERERGDHASKQASSGGGNGSRRNGNPGYSVRGASLTQQAKKITNDSHRTTNSKVPLSNRDSRTLAERMGV